MDIQIVDLGLYLPNHKALIFGDLHIGFEEALNKQGVLVPKIMFKETVTRLQKILKAAKPELVIINGDIKHEFSRISRQEWDDVNKILDIISTHAKEIIIVKGNHDNILEPILKKRGIKLVPDYNLKDFFITHGNKVRKEPKNTKIIVIGDVHPALGIKEGARMEKFKCFLFGRYKGKDLIIMPSINPASAGSDVERDKIASPYFNDAVDLEAYVVADKVYYFGKI